MKNQSVTFFIGGFADSLNGNFFASREEHQNIRKLNDLLESHETDLLLPAIPLSGDSIDANLILTPELEEEIEKQELRRPSDFMIIHRNFSKNKDGYFWWIVIKPLWSLPG